MKTVEEKAWTTLKQIREAITKYCDWQAIPQPDIQIGDMVMLNAKNIRSTRRKGKFTL